MNVNNVKLECTAVNPFQYPTDGKPQIAMVGRSNVGKSSLINYLVNRKALARVSSTPGKTREINFYNVEDKLYLVDLPGYGYAKVSKIDKDSWGSMVNSYFLSSITLKAVILLLDIRHVPAELDAIMLDWIRKSGLNLIVAATKADKVTQKDVDKYLDNIRSKLCLTNSEVIVALSTLKRFGRDELWNAILERVDV